MKAFDVSPDSLEKALQLLGQRFDPVVGLLHGNVGQIRYHTCLVPGTPVHPTRESVDYAGALLLSENPAQHALSRSILEKVLPMQDLNPESPSCGVWPWYFEEPLEKMSPPDWNWADFIGAVLSEILVRSSLKLPQDMVLSIKRALGLAASSIMKRDVRLSYTNIAIMGTYVSIMAGTLLQDAPLLDYGRKRLRRFVDFTNHYGGFPEYNSPTYALICLVELTRMLRDFENKEDLKLVHEIHDRVWEEIAVHWHAPSRQWAGPHSRSYSTLLKADARAHLQTGLEGRALLDGASYPLPASALLMPLYCPDKFVPYFLEQKPRRRRGMPISEEKPVFKGCMYMEPEFVLSSAQRAVFWNQARGLVAYAPAEKEAAAMTLRFLHDGYDFSSGNLLCSQKDNRVMAGLCLAHDRGDKHPELDRFEDKRINAEDWRLRLEFFNQPPDLLEGDWSLGQSRILPFGSGTWLGIKFLYGFFGNEKPFFETGSEDNRSWVDLVFYRGSSRVFILDGDFPATAGLGIVLSSDKSEAEQVSDIHVATGEADRILEGFGRKLHVPVFPAAEAEIIAFARTRNLT